MNSILHVLNWSSYRRCNWHFVLAAWVDLSEQLLRMTALVAVIAAAVRYLAS